MAYVLNLVPPQTEGAERPAAKGALDRLRAGLGEAGEVADGEPGTLQWTKGDTRMDVRLSADREGRLNEIDVVLPYGALLEEVESAVRHLADIAEAGALQVFDPQLGRSVGRGDVAAISACFAQASAYHVEYTGMAEDSRQGLSTAAAYERPTLISPRAKVFAVAIGVLVALYFLFRVIVLDPLANTLAPKPELGPPEGGPPPGWLDRHPPSR
jgi:hypothetical protein